MTTDSPKWQAPKPKRSAMQWLLDSDPSIRWQVMRDLTDASDEEIAAERAKIATDGWGATLLAAQPEDGTWPADPRFPELPTVRTSLLLHDMGLEPASEQAKRAVGRVRANVKWLMNIARNELPKDEDISARPASVELVFSARLGKFRRWPDNACTGRLGLCTFLELFLNFSSFPFRALALPSLR